MQRERERDVCARAEQKLSRCREREREMCVRALNRNWAGAERGEREMCVAHAEQKLSRCREREREMCVRALNRNWAGAERERERCVCARWTETEQVQRERERDVCARTLNRNWADAEREREVCVCVLRKQDSRRQNKVWALFEGKKVTKGVCNVAKLATLCISISPTTGWATGQTENMCCVYGALIKWVPLKGICVNA